MNRLIENIKGRFVNSTIRRFYRLEAAYSIAAELLSSIDLEDSLKILVNRIASYMSVEIVSIMFIDNERQRLIIKITKGLNEEVVRSQTGARIEEGPAGWVAKNGEPLLVRDITKDARFTARPGGRYHNNSLLSVPLKIRGRIMGVVNINNKISKDVFREYDLELLKTISDLAAITIELIRMEEQTAKNQKNNHELISNVTHDLKTPLATIKEALLLMLEGSSGAINAKQKRYLEISMQNVERMARIIDEIMLSQKPKRNLFNVAEAARDTLGSLEVLAKKQGIVLEGSIPDRKIEIWGYPEKFNEIMSNLVENAIKYNKPEGRVNFSLEDDEKSVTISVRDTGPGIPKDDIGMIFDRYYRISRDASRGIPGTGLGLSIVKDIVNMHKGNISVESENSEGTKFTVTLPKDLRV